MSKYRKYTKKYRLTHNSLWLNELNDNYLKPSFLIETALKTVEKWKNCWNKWTIGKAAKICKKFLTGAIFLLTPAANMFGTSRQFPVCMKRQHAFIFGADLGNWQDQKFLSPKTDGTPHSSSDLLYFTPLFSFTSTKSF